jgi:cyclophilin family peptidyl-prolyl cis-trans isomerase
MADRAPRWRRRAARLALVVVLLATAVVGCRRGTPAVKKQAAPEPAVARADAAPGDARLNQSFKDATRPASDPPPSAPRPPDTTVTGKSVGKLFTEVERLWKEVPFVTPEGKRVEYAATLETEIGTIEMALLSDAAPNHVRSFVALARAGYYDGLMFDRIVHQESDDKKVLLDLVEAGGPLGPADLEEHDSIGYWLKPEIGDKLRHEEGTVGAVRGTEMDSAACKFYIVLDRPPDLLNGNYTIFGKVTGGLDVVRKIHGQPVIEDEQEIGYRRPEKPVVIRKVTVQTKEVDAPPTNGDEKK